MHHGLVGDVYVSSPSLRLKGLFFVLPAHLADLPLRPESQVEPDLRQRVEVGDARVAHKADGGEEPAPATASAQGDRVRLQGAGDQSGNSI